MSKSRVVETNEGIQGEFDVALYDQMQRHLRDRGFIETKQLIASGMSAGSALELGPGPGYLGLEWLKRTANTTLVGLEISPEMIALAERNAAHYGLAARAHYMLGDGAAMPFAEGHFGAVFSNGSLHEWADPRATFAELWRVLRCGGRLYVSDLRRDLRLPVRWFLQALTKPRQMRSGLASSIAASYTLSELEALLRGSALGEQAKLSANPVGLVVTARKPA